MLTSHSNLQHNCQSSFNPNTSFHAFSVFPILSPDLVTLTSQWQDAAHVGTDSDSRGADWLASRLNTEVNFLSQRSTHCISALTQLPTVIMPKEIHSHGNIFLCQIWLKLPNGFKFIRSRVTGRQTDSVTAYTLAP